jgi:hypothetical protein
MTLASSAQPTGFAEQWRRCWDYVLDIALTIWILRAPVASLIFGAVILWFTPQAQDLFVDLATAGAFAWLRFLAILILVWAVPTEYAAHILITTDLRYRRPITHEHDRFREALKHWSPKILGALVFILVLVAVVRSLANVPSVADAHYTEYVRQRLAWFALVLVGFLVAFWCIAREEIAKKKFVRMAERAAAAVLRPLRQRLPPIFGLSRKLDAGGIESDLGPLLLILLFLLFAALPTAYPFFFAKLFPRAAAVPFVIGGWIPVLAVLSGLGRRLRAPLILFALVLKTILSTLLQPGYQVKVIDSKEVVAALTQQKPDQVNVNWTDPINLSDAITWWKIANGCDGNQDCPRPIVVAAAGGASRAGFFTASVIGQLLDDQLKTDPEASGHRLSVSDLTNRLFAFSTVSGSSVAAVMTVAALAASDQGKPPCKNRPEVWYGNDIGNSWRNCLESLLAGDFLTPIFTGLMFHDTMRFLRLTDRGSLLEQSWRDHFHNVTDSQVAAKDDLACVGSLACPFMTLRPGPKRWLPLLVLNGTSVGTGRRIITTALRADYTPQSAAKCSTGPFSRSCKLFVDAYRFHDLLNRPTGKGGTQPHTTRDIDLSAAATNSARFPLVSPPGEIRDSGGAIVDRLVDGGYFENSGVLTATELVQAIIAVDPKLDPFVLIISNNPEVPEREGAEHEQEKEVGEDIRTDAGALMTDFSAPIVAFAYTRDARGTLAVQEAKSLLYRPSLGSCHIAQIRVWGEPLGKLEARNVSMSWWLSKPLQIDLHEQTEFNSQGLPVSKNGNNGAAIAVLLEALKSPLPHSTAVAACP